jgi:DNA-binding transcriptional activator of the SARP family
VLICLLGSFRVLKNGRQVDIRPGGKVEALLTQLALRSTDGVRRDEILELLWPSSDAQLATRSLNTLVYTVHRTVGDALEGASPIIKVSGRYRLNSGSGVAVDTLRFEAAVDEGDRFARSGEALSALDEYERAIRLYTGDLAVATDVSQILERERLRARYLSLWSRRADQYFSSGNYSGALSSALVLMEKDPCREDAHRMAMRCYVRLAMRAQALRQYRLCCSILALEFQVEPEPSTVELFELIRNSPAEV